MIKLFICLVFFTVRATVTNGQNIVRDSSQNQIKDSSTRDFLFSGFKPVELPRPNSGAFSYKQAGKRKQEIFNLELTPKYLGWKNPTLGGAIHINKKDEIEVYKFTVGILESKTDSVINYIDSPMDTFVIITNPKDLHYYVGGIGEGNPASVLITSEIRLDKSQSIKKVIQEMWVPSVQIYYLTKIK